MGINLSRPSSSFKAEGSGGSAATSNISPRAAEDCYSSSKDQRDADPDVQPKLVGNKEAVPRDIISPGPWYNPTHRI